MPGPSQTLEADGSLLVEAASKPGLQVNASKCEIIVDDYSVTTTMKIFVGFRETPPHELTLILKDKVVDEALNIKQV